MEAKTKNILFWAGVSTLVIVGGFLIYKKYIKEAVNKKEEGEPTLNESKPEEVSGTLATSVKGALEKIQQQTGVKKETPKGTFVRTKADGVLIYKDGSGKELYYTAPQNYNVGVYMGEVTNAGTTYNKAMTIGMIPTTVYVQKDKSYLSSFLTL